MTEVSLRCAFEKKGRRYHSTFAENAHPNTSRYPNSTLLCARSRPGSCGWRPSPGSRAAPRVRRLVAPAFGGDAFEREGRVQRGFAQRTRNFVPFDVRAARTRRGADGVVWIRDTPRERRLALRVTPAMPRLECRVLNVPASMPAGAVAKITLVARNVAASVRHASDTSCRIRRRRSGHVRAYRYRDRGAARARAFAR